MEPRGEIAVGYDVREAPMQAVNDHDRVTVETLAAVIAHSQIVVAQPARPPLDLPAGFDDVDVAILDWIAAEGRRVSRNFLPM